MTKVAAKFFAFQVNQGNRMTKVMTFSTTSIYDGHVNRDVSPSLAHVVLDLLDVGITVVRSETSEIIYANPVALRAFKDFDADDSQPKATKKFPKQLRNIGDSLNESILQFCSALSYTAPSGLRYFVRGRRIEHPVGSFIMTIAGAQIREIDVRRTLSAEYGLNAQEIRVAHLASQGYRNREIAHELKIVEGTVKNYLTNVYCSLSVRNRTELTSELHQLLEEQTDIHRRRV